MSHLGSKVTALADGELPPEEAEVLLAHVAGCAACGWRLAQERVSRTTLSEADDVRPDPALTDRLLALELGSTEEPRGGRHRRVALVGAGVGALAGAAVVGLVVVGGISEPQADPHAILSAATGHSGVRPAGLSDDDGTDEATDDAVAWMEEHGWSAPRTLPPGMRVVDVEVHETDAGEILEVEIAGAMAHVRLLQQRGVLVEEPAAEPNAQLTRPAALGLPTGLTDVALQSGDSVVLVLAAADDAPVSEQILAALPQGDYDTSVGARLARGWQTLSEWGRD